MADTTLMCAVVGQWRIFMIEVSDGEKLASVKQKVHANGSPISTKTMATSCFFIRPGSAASGCPTTSSDEVAVSVWTPPTAVTEAVSETVQPIEVVTVQAPAGCQYCESKRSPIFTADMVTGIFVKLMRHEEEELTVERIQTQLPAESVVAISYTWWTLPHDQRVANSEREDGELSMVLSTDIAAIYSSCRVCCLVATLPCDRFQALQRETAALGAPEDYPELLEAHMKECDCTVNWNVYFSRIWPWQEFAISTNIEFYLGLRQRNLISTAGIRTLLTAMNQVAVKLADRIWGGTFDALERNNREAAALLVLGWGVRADPRKKVSTIDTLCFMSSIAVDGDQAARLLLRCVAALFATSVRLPDL
ncbi:hypothetical protein PHYPSEUDO_008801 [Phytophthora pseudosyringae]|uniref:Uncharacterized protein n=1 Tax=Phytophthora pseudosyringae TaxID=221518 RepID=A0A8T1WBN4_9STRA|nr:hypothetical protein PHYPSEUDO_008801 [Phytophthora pseudosyringae]